MIYNIKKSVELGRSLRIRKNFIIMEDPVPVYTSWSFYSDALLCMYLNQRGRERRVNSEWCRGRGCLGQL